MMRLIRIFLFIASTLLAACGSQSASNREIATSKPQPLPPEAERIEKTVNVSFSTYSKDWPVGWQWIDPEESVPTPKDTKKGVLRVRIPTGKNLVPGKQTAPRYTKPVTGDFEIETRVAFLPKENYQGAGLIVYLDDRNYLRFERSYGGSGGGAEGLRVEVMDGQGHRPLVTADEIPTDLGSVDLKLVRRGNTFTAFWRSEEGAQWAEVVKYVSAFPPTINVGLTASNTARDVIVEFGYIKLNPASGP